MTLLRIERLERRDLLSGDVLIEINRLNNITGVYVAYGGSAFADEVATDKTPLRVGETATFDNYTSYPQGINGVAIDIYQIPDEAEIAATNFVFRVGRSDHFNTWDIAPDPSEVVIARDSGVNGADRVLLYWEDGAIVNQWLSITVLPGDFDLQSHFDFEPAASEPFFFGNLVGETTGDFLVNYDDVFNVIWPNLYTTDPVGVDHPADVNRDRLIDYGDRDAVWPNLFGSPLAEITPVYGDPVLEDRIAFSVAIGQLNARQEKERQEWFQDFAK